MIESQQQRGKDKIAVRIQSPFLHWIYSSHSSWEIKFPVYFRNKMTAFKTSEIKPEIKPIMPHINFPCAHFFISTFYLKIFKFPMFFQNIQIPWFSLSHFTFSISLFPLWSGNPVNVLGPGLNVTPGAKFTKEIMQS